MRRKYSTFGLIIHSEADLPLPELVSGEGGTDVVVRLGSVDRSATEATASGCRVRVTSEEVCLLWQEVGAFQVRGGREIIVDPAPDVEDGLLRLFILGPVLAVLLHQRGLLVLHASAVTMDGNAVVFMGGPGWGKSTLAAALYARGHGVVADDVTAVQLKGENLAVLPGFPQLKLWPDAVASLGNGFEKLPQLHSQVEKRALAVDRDFPQTPLPIKCIYVLEEGNRHEMEHLQPQEAFIELVRHSYGARVLQTVRASSHFLQCANLAGRVPVCRLKTHRSLRALPDLARFVEENLVQNIR